MSSCERRQAIANFASIEHIAAVFLRDSTTVPHVKVGAQLVAERLSEIEPLFLAHADNSADPWRHRWLNAAERWLDFYTSELRRLQDRHQEHVPDGTSWTMH